MNVDLWLCSPLVIYERERERERERGRKIKTNRTNGVEVLGRRGRKIKSIKSGEFAIVCGGEKKGL